MVVIPFRFDGRDSPARRWDIRYRVAASMAVTTTLLAGPPGVVVPGALVVFGLLAAARCRPGEALAVVTRLGIWLGVWAGLSWAFDPTLARAAEVGLQAARLVLVLLVGHVLFLAATPGDVTEGLRWFLGWLGPRGAWAAASMAGWALGSVPQALEQAQGLGEAAALRGLSARRHPVRAVKLVTLGLLVRTLGRSVDLASALEARGFGNAVPEPTLKSRPRDAGALVAVVLGCVLSWLIGGILSP